MQTDVDIRNCHVSSADREGLPFGSAQGSNSGFASTWVSGMSYSSYSRPTGGGSDRLRTSER